MRKRALRATAERMTNKEKRKPSWHQFFTHRASSRLHPSLSVVRPGRQGPALQPVERAAIRTAGLAGLLDGQEHSRMGVPQLHRRGRTMQRQIRCRDFDAFLRQFAGQRHGRLLLNQR